MYGVMGPNGGGVSEKCMFCTLVKTLICFGRPLTSVLFAINNEADICLGQ